MQPRVGIRGPVISSEDYKYSTLVADREFRAGHAVIPETWEAMRLYSRIWLPLARVFTLLFFDVCALAVAALLAYSVWAYGILHQPFELYKDLFAFILLVPFGYAIAGLYPGFGLGAAEAFRRLCLSNTVAFLVLMDLVFLMKLPDNYSRMTLVIAFAASLITVPTARLIAASITEHWSWWRNPAILVGNDAWAQATAEILNRRRALGYKAIGAINEGLPNPEVWTPGSAIPRTTAMMLKLAEQGKCSVIVQQGASQGVLESMVRRFPPRHGPDGRRGGIAAREFAPDELWQPDGARVHQPADDPAQPDSEAGARHDCWRHPVADRIADNPGGGHPGDHLRWRTGLLLSAT